MTHTELYEKTGDFESGKVVLKDRSTNKIYIAHRDGKLILLWEFSKWVECGKETGYIEDTELDIAYWYSNIAVEEVLDNIEELETFSPGDFDYLGRFKEGA